MEPFLQRHRSRANPLPFGVADAILAAPAHGFSKLPWCCRSAGLAFCTKARCTPTFSHRQTLCRVNTSNRVRPRLVFRGHFGTTAVGAPASFPQCLDWSTSAVCGRIRKMQTLFYKTESFLYNEHGKSLRACCVDDVCASVRVYMSVNRLCLAVLLCSTPEKKRAKKDSTCFAQQCWDQLLSLEAPPPAKPLWARLATSTKAKREYP